MKNAKPVISFWIFSLHEHLQLERLEWMDFSNKLLIENISLME